MEITFYIPDPRHPPTRPQVVLGFVSSTDPDFPRQRLFDFTRVALAPGEQTTVL